MKNPARFLLAFTLLAGLYALGILVAQFVEPGDLRSSRAILKTLFPYGAAALGAVGYGLVRGRAEWRAGEERAFAATAVIVAGVLLLAYLGWNTLDLHYFHRYQRIVEMTFNPRTGSRVAKAYFYAVAMAVAAWVRAVNIRPRV